VKPWASVWGINGVHAVEDHGVEVDVEIEGRAEALDSVDRARAAALRSECLDASAVEAEDGVQEAAAHGRAQCRPAGEQVAQAPGQGEHPLAHGDPRQDVIAKVGGRLGHATSSAGGTEPPSLAGEGHEVVGAAARAEEARGAVGRDPAREVGAQLARHVAG